MIRIRIINPEFENHPEKQGIWYTRSKTYEWELNHPMDDDIKNSAVGHQLDSIELKDIFLKNKRGVQDFIDFLTNAKESMDDE